MNGINSLVIEGNLVRDAVIKETSSGNVVSNFSIAVNRSVKTHNGETHKEVSFFDIEAWGDLAKAIDFTDPENEELNMTFQFECTSSTVNGTKCGKFTPKPVDMEFVKHTLAK